MHDIPGKGVTTLKGHKISKTSRLCTVNQEHNSLIQSEILLVEIYSVLIQTKFLFIHFKKWNFATIYFKRRTLSSIICNDTAKIRKIAIMHVHYNTEVVEQ